MVCVQLTSEMERILCLLFLHRICIAKYTRQCQLKICHSRSQQCTCCAMWPKTVGLWPKMGQSISWCIRYVVDRSLEITFGMDLLNYSEASLSSLAVNPPRRACALWQRQLRLQRHHQHHSYLQPQPGSWRPWGHGGVVAASVTAVCPRELGNVGGCLPHVQAQI